MNFDNPVYRKTTEEEEEEEEEIHIGRTMQIGHVYPAVSIQLLKTYNVEDNRTIVAFSFKRHDPCSCSCCLRGVIFTNLV